MASNSSIDQPTLSEDGCPCNNTRYEVAFHLSQHHVTWFINLCCYKESPPLVFVSKSIRSIHRPLQEGAEVAIPDQSESERQQAMEAMFEVGRSARHLTKMYFKRH